MVSIATSLKLVYSFSLLNRLPCFDLVNALFVFSSVSNLGQDKRDELDDKSNLHCVDDVPFFVFVHCHEEHPCPCFLVHVVHKFL